ncbi:arginine--tRNA ligase [Labedaea rhizosphaerae]|nr:arginine--tRNA ligase [Labedaea rhizosphaerae]
MELGARVAAALRTGLDVRVDPVDTLIRPSTRDGVDYQCNIAMSLAKKLGRPPREVATALVEALDAADMVAETEIAGPGFVNFVLRDDWLAERVAELLGDPRAGVPVTDAPRRFALDYSSPNVAKTMHVGNMRSTVIGDALHRLLAFAGHEVLPHNHLGDWGTPFGMLIEHMLDSGLDGSITDLNAFYQQARAKFDADEAFATRSRDRVVKLQAGDEQTRQLWQRLVDESARHFQAVYDLLGIRLTQANIYGESFYNPYLGEVVDELTELGLTEVSDGAVCVFPPGFTGREGQRLPLIVRKSDGGYGYAATDLATARYWTRERDVTDLLYVVGSPQAQHFQMVFAVCTQAGYLTDKHRAEHIAFGSVLGADGKMMRTRAGESVALIGLLEEAVARAAKVIEERSELAEADRAAVARAVGIGAVKYADLAGDRLKDYVFTWEKMLAKDGNTSVYLQYAIARIRSVLRKAGETVQPGTAVRLGEPAERALAVKLLQLPAAIDAAVAEYAPHKLCGYLFETASAFTGFYENCPILASSTPDDVRGSRLALAALTADVLVLGLSLLGIDAPERL